MWAHFRKRMNLGITSIKKIDNSIKNRGSKVLGVWKIEKFWWDFLTFGVRVPWKKINFLKVLRFCSSPIIQVSVMGSFVFLSWFVRSQWSKMYRWVSFKSSFPIQIRKIRAFCYVSYILFSDKNTQNQRTQWHSHNSTYPSE